jgi:CRISPR system Cascade subunit CasE
MSLFASVLHLDRSAVKALRITDAYSLHRVIYSLYEDVRDAEQKQTSTPSGILYVDQGGDYKGRKVLMLANREPKSCIDGAFGEVVVKVIPDDFLEHDLYRFKVVVNPTRRDSESRKLVAIRGRDEISKWFLERAVSSWGFEVSPRHLQVDKIEVQKFKDKNQNLVTIGQAHMQGLLRITDRELFNRSFSQGIGRGRAYGCGLLQIVPIIDNPFM